MSALVPDFWGVELPTSDSGKLLFFVPRAPVNFDDDTNKIGYTADVILRLTTEIAAIDDGANRITLDEYLFGQNLAESA